MSPLVILGIALGLAMDCFAVAIASSVVLRGATGRQTFRLSFYSGCSRAQSGIGQQVRWHPSLRSG